MPCRAISIIPLLVDAPIKIPIAATMRINNGFEIREMCGENIIIATGLANIDFSKVISLNESAAWLWKQVEGKEFTVEMLAELLMERYAVDKNVALADANELTQQWIREGVVAE